MTVVLPEPVERESVHTSLRRRYYKPGLTRGTDDGRKLSLLDLLAVSYDLPVMFLKTFTHCHV
jgi:hypothetical protein